MTGSTSLITFTLLWHAKRIALYLDLNHVWKCCVKSPAFMRIGAERRDLASEAFAINWLFRPNFNFAVHWLYTASIDSRRPSGPSHTSSSSWIPLRMLIKRLVSRSGPGRPPNDDSGEMDSDPSIDPSWTVCFWNSGIFTCLFSQKATAVVVWWNWLLLWEFDLTCRQSGRIPTLRRDFGVLEEFVSLVDYYELGNKCNKGERKWFELGGVPLCDQGLGSQVRRLVFFIKQPCTSLVLTGPQCLAMIVWLASTKAVWRRGDQDNWPSGHFRHFVVVG